MLFHFFVSKPSVFFATSVSSKVMKGSSGKTSIIRLMLIIVAAIVLFALVAYYNSHKPERFSTALPTQAPTSYPTSPTSPTSLTSPTSPTSPTSSPTSRRTTTNEPFSSPSSSAPIGVEPLGNDKYRPVARDPAVGSAIVDPFPQDKITPEDLLPKDANSRWAQMNPAGQGDVKDQNFLSAGYHTGYNTQGSSLRNASLDLRSSPPNPRYNVSIWSQSTIEPDMNRRPLE